LHKNLVTRMGQGFCAITRRNGAFCEAPPNRSDQSSYNFQLYYPYGRKFFYFSTKEIVPSVRLRPNRGDQSSFLSSSNLLPEWEKIFLLLPKEMVPPMRLRRTEATIAATILNFITRMGGNFFTFQIKESSQKNKPRTGFGSCEVHCLS